MSGDVVGPDEWRDIANAAAGVPEDFRREQCRALKRDGERCRMREAGLDIGLCRFHGGGTIISQDQARRRLEMIRSAMFDELCEAAVEAVETYIHIMKHGEKDTDRLRAADRVLMLMGVDDTLVEKPERGDDHEDDIDSQLRRLLATAAPERLQRAIEVTSTEVDA